MKPNPYLVEGPALISFSGGRTSGYMLWHILDAYDGKLPSDVHVTFANTGKEKEQTLRFVHECASRWGVRINWLEWRSRKKSVPAEERFEIVGYNSAARDGEPFAALIKSKSFVPNQAMRFCTEHLKVQVMIDYMISQGLEPGTYREALGLRADEFWRFLKMMDRNERDKRQCIAPLVKAKATKADVMAFWADQPFDLGLKSWEGNCDLCFLKGPRIIKRMIRDDPKTALWWDRMEKTGSKGTFVTEHSISDLVREVARQPLLNLEDGDDEEFDAECGLWCGEGEG